MAKIAFLNSPTGDPEVHAARCPDISKKTSTTRGFTHAGYAEVETAAEASADYNDDFIEDGASGDELWELKIYPCAGLARTKPQRRHNE